MAKEYIEREAAKRELLSWAVSINHPEYLIKDDALHIIDSFPAADVVEVLRCRDCKFGSWDSEPDDAMVCMRTKDGFWRSGNDFCSRGERNEYNRRAGEEGKHE